MKRSTKIFFLSFLALATMPVVTTSDVFAATDNAKKTQCEDVRKGKFVAPNSCWCDGAKMPEGSKTCDEIKAENQKKKAEQKQKMKDNLDKTKEKVKANNEKIKDKIKESNTKIKDKIETNKKNRQEKKAASELEKQFNSDMDTLRKAFNKTITAIKKACTDKSGVIDAQTLKCKVTGSEG